MVAPAHNHTENLENLQELTLWMGASFTRPHGGRLMILPVDQNVGNCLVKGSTCAPLQTSVLLQDPPQEPAKEQSSAAAADRTPTPKSVTEPPNTKSKNTQENSRNPAMFSLTVSSRTRKRKEYILNVRVPRKFVENSYIPGHFLSPGSYRPRHVARIQSYTCHHLEPP